MTNKIRFDFNTDYNTFYVCDFALAKQSYPYHEIETLKERMGYNKNGVVFYAQSYGRIRGDLFLLKKENEDFKEQEFDHIEEVGINCKGGKIILNPFFQHDSDVSTISVTPGNYKVRIYMSNALDVGLGEQEGGDRYRIEFWPSEDLSYKCLKAFTAGDD